MPNRFCAICGKDLDEFAPNYGMCLKCYLKENLLFKLPVKLSIKICLDCGNYSQKKVWIEPESNELFFIIEDSIRRFVLKPYFKKNYIDFSIFFDQESFVYSSKDLLKSLISMVRGTLKSDNKITYQEKINVNLNYDLCKTCSNLRGGTYFLSIIQLRVKDETYFNLIKEVLDEIHIYVEKLNEKDRKQYISKIEDQKFGVDLYLSTNELMNYIIKFLKSNYHFILKRSKKLVGRDSQKGRNLYRLKSLIKFLPINKNDIILIDNQKYIVEKLSKNKVLLRNEQGTKLIKEYPYFFSNKILIKNRMEEKSLENNDFSVDDDLDEELEDELVDKMDSSIDNLEKKKIDNKRIKKIDQTKKRAVIESVFDERTVFQLNKLLTNGPLERIEGVISAGKEANVYLAYDQKYNEVAVKIYKIDSNTSKWMRNYIIGDPRFKKIPHNVSKIIYLWASKEYKNLQRAFKARLSVPEPLYVKNNILIMEYIGFESIPAPLLKDIKNPKDLINLFNEVLMFIKILYQKAKLVHGDLSEFNILYHNQKPVIIDISQAVSIQHPKAEIYLVRDIKNIFNYFEKMGLEIPDPKKFYYDVINL